jgi:hypothetical protein
MLPNEQANIHSLHCRLHSTEIGKREDTLYIELAGLRAVRTLLQTYDPLARISTSGITMVLVLPLLLEANWRY